MTSTARTQHRYDHRLRELVQTTGDITLATQHGVPASTARGWLTQSKTDVVSLDVLDLDTIGLQQDVLRLRCHIARLTRLLRLAIVVLQVSGFSFARVRLVEGTDKKRLLRAIGLSRARDHDWNTDERCSLDDRSSCPKALPHQLTRDEVNTIRDMVTSPKYRHVPTNCLARLAQRLGRVFASSTTWYRLIQIHKWRRCRQ